MATYRKRGSGWHVQVRRQGHRSRTRAFSFKDDAEVWARQIERELDRDGITSHQRPLKATTLADLLTRYRDADSPTKRGREIETIRLNCLARHRSAKRRMDQCRTTRNRARRGHM
ncbi:MAG TPA: hypothetical protein VGA34_05640 [Alteraurantiacibacter sp.]